MSKVNQDSLFRLIHALSKSEKWQFKVYARRFNPEAGKQFLTVFDLLEGAKIYDTSVAEAVKAINPLQIHNIKLNLYRQVLQSLIHQHALSRQNRGLRFLEYAQFLYNKCLYTDCLTFIEKGKKYARENFQLTSLLELLELEKMAIWQTSDAQIAGRIDKLLEETSVLSSQIQNITRLSNVADRLNAYYQQTGFIRNHKELLQVSRYYKQNLPKVELRQLSVPEKMYWFATVTGYYFFIQDFKKGYENAGRLMALFDENPSLRIAKTEFYIKALNNLLVAQNKLNHYTDFNDTHKKLVSIKRDKQIAITENIALNLFKAIYIHEINRHFMMGAFKSGTRIVGALQKELDGFIPMLNKHTVMVFYYKIACLYFGAGQFKVAVKWLNKIINEKASNLRQDLQAFARIIRLICYFEMDDGDMLDYNIRSTYRFLLSKQSFIAYHQLIVKFLRTMHPGITRRQLVVEFNRLRTGMLELEKNRFEKRAFLYFDMISWLDSKIEGVPVDVVVRRKFEQYKKDRE